jgi:membrane fusion protein (multidrug efflux system)
MFSRVRVDIGTRKDSITIPERALVSLQGKSFVWVISPEGIANQRAVTTAEQVDSNILISEGLKPGERIILEGIQKVREGAPVKALNASQMAAMQSAPAAEMKPAKH